jgi:hypothetical protein
MEDTVFLELLATWKRLKKGSHYAPAKKFVGSEPLRRNDADTVPLQGADLVAGLMWRACHGKGAAPSLIEGLTINHRAFAWDEKTLPGLFAGIDSAQLEHGILYENAKARSKRLKPHRQLLREKEGAM